MEKVKITPGKYVKAICDGADLTKQDHDYKAQCCALCTHGEVNIKLRVHQYIAETASFKRVFITVDKEQAFLDDGRQVELDFGVQDPEAIADTILTERANGKKVSS